MNDVLKRFAETLKHTEVLSIGIGPLISSFSADPGIWDDKRGSDIIFSCHWVDDGLEFETNIFKCDAEKGKFIDNGVFKVVDSDGNDAEIRMFRLTPVEV